MDKQIEELTNDIIKSLSTEYIYAQSEVMEHLSDIRVLVSSLISKRWRKLSEGAVVLRLKERLDISVNGYSTSEVMSEIEDKIDEIAKEITEGEV